MQLKDAAEVHIQMNSAQRDEQPTADRNTQQEHNYQYYQQYRRLYHTAHLLSIQLRQLTENKHDLWVKLGVLQKKTDEFRDDIRGQAPQRKKRFRRTADEIDRPFECEVDKCRKCYGSEGSLHQHIKLKHPELFECKSNQRREIVESDDPRNQSYFN